MSVDLTYTRLTSASGEDLITQAYGCQPAGIILALGKLGVAARPVDVYRALVRVLAAGGLAAKFIWHAQELPDEVIRGLASLPPNLRLKPVLDVLKAGVVGAESLCFFAGTVTRLEIVQGAHLAQTILAASKPLDALWDALQDLPFPEPPWPGNEYLLAVTSRSRLVEIAKQFQNCLSRHDRQLDAVMSVINGNRYFYELQEEPGLLEFVRIGSLGWYLREACGPKNHEISEETRGNVLRVLSQEPSFCAVWEPRWRGRWDGGDTSDGLLRPE
ncbi:hypothetical protein [Microvirga aerophila]|nr:hypothetical protein [Microvirga aerophila]